LQFEELDLGGVEAEEAEVVHGVVVQGLDRDLLAILLTKETGDRRQ